MCHLYIYIYYVIYCYIYIYIYVYLEMLPVQILSCYICHLEMCYVYTSSEETDTHTANHPLIPS